MRSLIYEIGVIDKLGGKHTVKLKKGLNVVTGKSSTGKSALIEIFDYCFGSGENTIPKGVITDCAAIYYVALSVNGADIIIARDPNLKNKAFFRRVDFFDSSDVNFEYFSSGHFMALSSFKDRLKGFFLDFDDVDESLSKKEARGKKAPTPSIRSFMSFILQHQNLVANKHALFYRFDEKQKRDQVIDHVKIFLGMVDQAYFHLSQERERLSAESGRLKRQRETARQASESFAKKIGPVLGQLYALMGFEQEPVSLQFVLHNPEDAKLNLDKIVVPEMIDHDSSAAMQRYNQLKIFRTQKTADIRKLQRQAASIDKHIQEEERFVSNVRQYRSPKSVYTSATVCPFCHTESEGLGESAQKLYNAIIKVSGDLSQARPMKAKFESSLVDVRRSIENVADEIKNLNQQIVDIEKTEKEMSENKSLYESILMQKAKLFMLIDTMSLADDSEADKEVAILKRKISSIEKKMKRYNVKSSLESATKKVNQYMAEIGELFEFEESYQPINLRFSFETFDLYHLQGNEKIYLRSMGSGANWLYSHMTLFLALHKYFAELGGQCSIPSILFFDQPTQVYFPNFNRDNSTSFEEQKIEEVEQRKKSDLSKKVDEDVRAVENLFSQLSVYCNEIARQNGFSPQIIVTDHADNLTLSNEESFELLVNGNRWRARGLIDPVPKK